MVELKKILVPMDFSALGREAFQTATNLARQFEAQVTLLHCVDDTSFKHIGKFGNVFRREARSDLVRSALERLDGFLRFKHIDGVAYRRKVALGPPAVMIPRVARRGVYDLIVIAASDKSAVEITLFGNTTDKVVRTAPCPVLCVRSGTRRIFHD